MTRLLLVHVTCKAIVTSSWVLLYVHRNRRLIWDGSPGRPPQLSHSSWAASYYHINHYLNPLQPCRCAHTGIHTYMQIRPTWPFCCWALLYVHRNHRLIRDGSPGRPPRFSHSSWTLFAVDWWWLKCCFTSTETVDLLGMGALDGHLEVHTAPELCCWVTKRLYTVWLTE